MRNEKAVYPFLLKFGQDGGYVPVVIQKPFAVDVVDVHQLHTHLQELILCETPVFNCIRSAENAAPGGGVSQLDSCAFHRKSLFLFL